MDSVKLSERFLAEHFLPNKYHTETGIWLLWHTVDGVKVDLVDWELYSLNPARGPNQDYAFRSLFDTAARLEGIVVPQ